MFSLQRNAAVSQKTNTTGYLTVVLRGADGYRNCHLVHRLVLQAFRGLAPAGKPQCRHLDGIKAANFLENLAWGSAHDNYMDSLRHGTCAIGIHSKRWNRGQ